MNFECRFRLIILIIIDADIICIDTNVDIVRVILIVYIINKHFFALFFDIDVFLIIHIKIKCLIFINVFILFFIFFIIIVIVIIIVLI